MAIDVFDGISRNLSTGPGLSSSNLTSIDTGTHKLGMLLNTATLKKNMYNSM